jgi:ADP-heptose:LPS heptosyltransferase
MKFLIIRFSSIGDIVLTTPVIRCLRKRYPEAEIHYATKLAFQPILASNPYVNKVHLLKDDINALTEELKAENFDYIIDLHHNIRTLRIKKALNVKSFSYNKVNIQKWVLVNTKFINVLPDKHIVDRYMDTVKSLGVMNDGLGLDYFIPEKDKLGSNDIPTSHIHGYIGIAIGAQHYTKKLPVEKLKELCSKIDYPIILLGGKEDIPAATEISGVDRVKVYNACGKFNINESADLVRNAKLIISHDTGLMHIAAAFKKNIISVWGNTVPSFGMYPYQTFYEAFEVKHLWCRPCTKIGFNKCPLSHFKCMKKQSIDEMVKRVNAFLKK